VTIHVVPRDEAQVADVKPKRRGMLATERRDLRTGSGRPWVESQFQPYDAKIAEVWSPEEATERFLVRFYELGGRDS